MNPVDLSAAQAAEDEAAEAADARRYLVAEAAGQRLGIPLLLAREILGVRAVTRLPGAQSWVAGLVNVRGSVLTVLDLGLRLGAAPSAGPVVVVEHSERRFGLRVTAVLGVSRAASAAEAVDEARSAGGAIEGLAAVDGGTVLVLDIEALQRAAIADA